MIDINIIINTLFLSLSGYIIILLLGLDKNSRDDLNSLFLNIRVVGLISSILLFGLILKDTDIELTEICIIGLNACIIFVAMIRYNILSKKLTSFEEEQHLLTQLGLNNDTIVEDIKNKHLIDEKDI